MIDDQISDCVNIIQDIPTILLQFGIDVFGQNSSDIWFCVAQSEYLWSAFELISEYQDIPGSESESESEFLYCPTNEDISLPLQPKDSNTNSKRSQIE